MVWSLSRKKKTTSTRSNKSTKRDRMRRVKRANLRLEGLEDRRLLAGVVNIDTTTTMGSITLQGDVSPNAVILSSNDTAGPTSVGVYTIDRPAGDTTQFTLNAQNGAPAQFVTLPFTIPNITGNPAPGGINVDLAGSNDSFTFNNSSVSSGANSVVNGNLNIVNDGGQDVNTISNVRVSGSLNIDDGFAGIGIVPGVQLVPTLPLFSPVPPNRLGGVPLPLGKASVATGSVATLTDVVVTGNVTVSQGGGNNLMITSVDAAAISPTNPVTSQIQGGLYVQPALGLLAAGGFNTVSISNNSQIVGPTMIAHNGGGSATSITNSRLQGSFPIGSQVPAIALASPVPPDTTLLLNPTTGATGVGLAINNDPLLVVPPSPGANDSLNVRGNTVIGELTTPGVSPAAPFTNAPFSQIAVSISNGPGGSSTTFGPDPNPAGPGMNVGPQIRGGLAIANGTNVFGTQDVLSMNVTNVFGPTFVYNAAGTSNTTITNSRLGSSTIVAPGVATGFGNPVVIINDAGSDMLVMNATDAPWGVFVNNDDAGFGMTPAFTHRTAITGGTNSLTGAGSSIGGLTSTLGTDGANMTAALQNAFPLIYPTLPGPINGQSVASVGGPGVMNVQAVGTAGPNPGNNTANWLNLFNALDALPAGTTGTQAGFNVVANFTDTEVNFDYDDDGAGGDFAVADRLVNTINNDGPGGGASAIGATNFAVRSTAFLTFRTGGTFTIAMGSDDGRRVQLTPASAGSAPGYSGFTSIGDQVNAATSPNAFGFSGTTVHDQSVGTFTVAAGDLLRLSAFYDQGIGPSSGEISIASGTQNTFNAANFTLLANGVQNIQMSPTDPRQTMTFQLAAATAPPSVGDSVSITSGPANGQSALITGVAISPTNVVTLTLASGTSGLVNVPNLNDTFSITRFTSPVTLAGNVVGTAVAVAAGGGLPAGDRVVASFRGNFVTPAVGDIVVYTSGPAAGTSFVVTGFALNTGATGTIAAPAGTFGPGTTPIIGDTFNVIVASAAQPAGPLLANPITATSVNVGAPDTISAANLIAVGTQPAVGDTVTITSGLGAGTTFRIAAYNPVTGTITTPIGFVQANQIAVNDTFNITRTTLLPRTPQLPGLLTTGESLFIGGGGGNDIVNIGQNPPPPGSTATSVDAPIPFGLQSQITINLGSSGVNSLNIQGSFATPLVAQIVRQLRVLGGNDDDTVTLQNIAVTDQLFMTLGTGLDILNLRGLTSIPNPLMGGVVVVSGGADFINDKIFADPGVLNGLPLGFTQFP